MSKKTFKLNLTFHAENTETVGELFDSLNLEIAPGGSVFVNGKKIQINGAEKIFEISDKDEISAAVRQSNLIQTIFEETGVTDLYQGKTRGFLNAIFSTLVGQKIKIEFLTDQLSKIKKIIGG